MALPQSIQKFKENPHLYCALLLPSVTATAAQHGGFELTAGAKGALIVGVHEVAGNLVSVVPAPLVVFQRNTTIITHSAAPAATTTALAAGKGTISSTLATGKTTTALTSGYGAVPYVDWSPHLGGLWIPPGKLFGCFARVANTQVQFVVHWVEPT